MRKQQDLYQRILSQIPNRNEHFDYLTGVKTFEDKKICVVDISSSSDPEPEPEVKVKEISKNNVTGKGSIVGNDSVELTASKSEKKLVNTRRSSRCKYNLDKICNDDVIEFFEKSRSLRNHWQNIMNEGEILLRLAFEGTKL